MASPDPNLSTIGLLALAADPTGTTAGESYWNTTLGCIRTYSGSAWTGSAAGAAGGTVRAFFLS